MSRHNYDNNVGWSSIESQRRAMEEQVLYARDKEEHRRKNEKLESLKRPMESLYRDAVFHLNPSNYDTSGIANTARSAYRTGGMIYNMAAGVALSVAAVAAAGIHAARVDSQAERLGVDLSNQDSVYKEIEDNLGREAHRAIPLGEYRADIAAANNEYKERALVAQSQYDATEREATAARSRAEENYKTSSLSIDQKVKDENDAYSEKINKYLSDKDMVLSDVDSRIIGRAEKYHNDFDNVTKSYENKVQEIQSSTLSEHEKNEKIQSLTKKRDEDHSALTEAYKSDRESLDKERDSAVRHWDGKIHSTENEHKEVISSLDNQRAGVESRYQQTKQNIDQKVAAAASARDSELKSANDAQRRSIDNTKNAYRTDSTNTETLKKIDIRSDTTVSKYNVFTGKTREIDSGVSQRRQIDDVRVAFAKNSKLIAMDLAYATGTDADRALLSKYQNDKNAERQYNKQFEEIKNGQVVINTRELQKHPYQTTLTSEEITRVGAIQQAFGASSLKNKEAIEACIKGQQEGINLLNQKNQEINGKLSILSKQIGAEADSLNQLNAKLSEARLAQIQLNSGKTFSPEELANLKAKAGQLTSLQKQCDSKKASLESKKQTAAEMRNQIHGNKTIIASATQNIALLKKNKGALISGLDQKQVGEAGKKEKKANKKSALAGHGAAAKKISDKAMKHFNSSSRGLQKRIEAKAWSGNVIHKEAKHIKRSLKNASQVYTFAVNGSFIVAGAAVKMLFFPARIPFVLGKKLNAQQAKILAKEKNNLALSARELKFRDKMMNKKLYSSLGKMGNFGSKFSKGVGAVSKVSKGVLLAPVKVLQLPSKIMDAPQTLAKGAAKLTLKASAKVAKLGGRVGGKGIRYLHKKTTGRAWKKLKDSKFGQGVKKAFNKMAKPFKKIAGRFNVIKKKLKALKLKILSAIGSFFMTILSYVMIGLLYITLFVLILVAFATIILLIITLILAVLSAILNFFYGLTADHDSYISNQPEYIMHMAANYRYEETRIFNFFRSQLTRGYQATNGRNKKDDGRILEISTDPLFYELYDSSFHWPWKDYKGAEQVLGDVKNTQGAGVLQTFYKKIGTYKDSEGNKQNATVKVTGDSKSTYTILNPQQTRKVETTFWSWFLDLPNTDTTDVTRDSSIEFPASIGIYDNVSVYYIQSTKDDRSDGVQWEDDKHLAITGINLETAQKNGYLSNYEISNAKDVLGMCDALYQIKNDAQTFEMLAYLGVGEAQLVEKDNTSQALSGPSLFWMSHAIYYIHGTTSDSIYFHETAQFDGSLDDLYSQQSKTYPVTEQIRYANGATGKSPGCQQYEEITLTYTIDKETPQDPIAKHTTTYASWLNDPGLKDDLKSNLNLQITSEKPSTASSQTITNLGNYAQFISSFTINNNNTSNYKATHLNSSDSNASFWKYSNDVYKLTLPIGSAHLYDSVSGSSKNNGSPIEYKYYKCGEIKVTPTSGLLKTLIDNNIDTIYCVYNYGTSYFAFYNDGSFVENPLYANPSYGSQVDLSDFKNQKITSDFKCFKNLDIKLTALPQYLVLKRSGNQYILSIFTNNNGTGFHWDDEIAATEYKAIVKLKNQCINQQYYGTNTFPDGASGARRRTENYFAVYFPKISKSYNNVTSFTCSHTTPQESTHEKTNYTRIIQICSGHIDLEAAIVVTTYDSKYSLYSLAQNIPAQEEEHHAAIYYKDDDAWISGWGGVTKKKYDPNENWKEDSDYRGLASAKIENDAATYEYTDEMKGRRKKTYLHQHITWENGYWGGYKVASIANADGHIAFPIYDGLNSLYYVQSYKSGEQKGLSAYKLEKDLEHGGEAFGGEDIPKLSTTVGYLSMKITTNHHTTISETKN